MGGFISRPKPQAPRPEPKPEPKPEVKTMTETKSPYDDKKRRGRGGTILTSGEGLGTEEEIKKTLLGG